MNSDSSRPLSWIERANPLHAKKTKEMVIDWRDDLVRKDMERFADIGVGSFAELYNIMAHMPATCAYDIMKEIGVNPRSRMELLYALDLDSSTVAPKKEYTDETEEKEANTPQEKEPHREVPRVMARASRVVVSKRVRGARYGGSWAYELPLINVFYDILFSRTPEFESIKSSMNQLLLLDILGLILVASHINGLSYDDITDFITRADAGRALFGCRNRGKLSYKALTKNTVNAYAFLGASLFSVLIFQVFSLNTAFGNTHALRIWWRYSSMHILIAALANIVGLVFAFLSFISVIQVKFPDYWVLDHADECPNGEDWPMEPKSAWGYSLHLLASTIYPGVCGSLIILSLAIRGKYRAERGMPDCGTTSNNASLLSMTTPTPTLTTTDFHKPEDVIELAQRQRQENTST